jgi:hypothetical protein
LAIEELSAFDLSPIEKVLLAREFRVPQWLTKGIAALASEFAHEKINEIAEAVGWQTTALILSLREKAEQKGFDSLTTAWICGYCDGVTKLEYTASEEAILCSSGGPSRCSIKRAYRSTSGVTGTQDLTGSRSKRVVSEAGVFETFKEELEALQK